MLFLFLSVLSSSLISVMMRLGEKKRISVMGMFVINYLVCTVLSCLFAGRIAFYTARPGIGLAMGLGTAAGFLFLVSFMLLQLNIEKNGMAMASTFMKLGVVVSTLIAVFVFHEKPRMPQVLGIFLAAVSILLIHTDHTDQAEARRKWLLPVLLVCGGVTDSMANVFDKVGNEAVRDYYLFYTFAAALLCASAAMLARHERIGREELLEGILVGIPNYFSTRFLLLSLASLPAVIVYPAVSVDTIVMVSLFGLLLFGEGLSRRKLLAMGLILLALILLNI